MARLELVSRDVHRMHLGGEPVGYMLVRRRGRRGVGLKVDESGLTVSAPATMPLKRIEALVRDSERWILRKIREWRSREVPPARWEDGAALPYLGGALALRVASASRPSVERCGEELRVAAPVDDAAEIRRLAVAWYRREARAYLHQRLVACAERALLAPPRFFLSSAMSRWGSCNSRREVRLAWRLVKAPPELIDYVVCHELAHLRHMDHSQAFWLEVERQCPGYRELRERLFATDHMYRSF